MNIKSCQRHINPKQTPRRISPNNKNQLEINKFYQELKNSLDPQARKTKPKRPVIGKRQNQRIKFKIPNQFNQNQQNIYPQHFQEKERVYYVPIGIRKGQNSSIMESLAFHKTQQHFRNQNKKSSMRKQKFNLKLNFNCLKNLQKDSKTSVKRNQKNDQSLTSNHLESSSIAKTGINKVKLITFQLKSQNEHLNEARKLCVFKNIKSERFTQIKNLEALNTQDIKQALLPNQINQNIKIQPKKFIEKLIDFGLQEYLQAKKFQKLIQTNNPRINDTSQMKRTQNQTQKAHNILTEQYLGWTNSNCKKRVQTFKNQYRKFINTQIFEKIIRANELQI